MMAVTQHKHWLAFIVSLALFMDALDTTIINTAIPAISHSLHVQALDLKIALISYLLSLAIFIPLSGWVADRFGLKRVFIIALAIFTLSSLWCGSASSLFELMLARSLQGLGGSLMLPLGRLIILNHFERHEFMATMNHVVMIVSIGLMLGPLAGGVITQHFSWHWIFWVNIPVGLLAISLAMYWLKETAPKSMRPFDWRGFILFGGGLAGLTFSLSYLSQTQANRHLIFLLMAIALCMLLVYFRYALQQAKPLVNMRLFRVRTFQIATLGNFFGRLSFSSLPFLLPLLLQIELHYSPQASGLLLAPIALGIFCLKSISLPILQHLGFKRLLLLNTLLMGLSLWSMCLINQASSMYFIASLTFIFGALMSLQYSGMNTLVYAEIAKDEMSSAATITSTVQQLAQSFSVAVGALLLHFYSQGQFNLTANEFHRSFFAMGLLTLLSILIFIRLKPQDGCQMLKQPLQEKVLVE